MYGGDNVKVQGSPTNKLSWIFQLSAENLYSHPGAGEGPEPSKIGNCNLPN